LTHTLPISQTPFLFSVRVWETPTSSATYVSSNA
jgi:hypothetical protein